MTTRLDNEWIIIAFFRTKRTSVMYDQSSVLIVGLLFVGLVLGIEAGYRISRRFRAHVNKSVRTQINAIQASMLGMIALLLGFTFSQSLERHDARSEAVVDEANAIGTAYLCAPTWYPRSASRHRL